MIETFECICGFKTEVIWNENESERNIPCGGCYWEEWIPSEENNQTEKITHGNIITCIKGNGI